MTLLALPWLISENQDGPTEAVGAVGVAAPGVGVPAVGEPLRSATLAAAGTGAVSSPPVPRAVSPTPTTADTEEGRATFVRYDDATVFDGGSAANLTPGARLEVNGVLRDGVLLAREIEFDD